MNGDLFKLIPPLLTIFSAAAPLCAQVTTPADPPSNSTPAPEDEALPERPVSLLGSVDFVPKLRWSAHSITNEKHLYYTFQDSTLLTVSGNLVSTKLGLSLGLDASVDNNQVNKAYKIGASLGYKEFTLRVQKGSLEGSVRWDGSLVDGQPDKVDFKNKYTNVDVLYYLKKSTSTDLAMYIGLGYTSFQIPMQVDTLVTDSDRAHQKNAVATYDPDYKITAYSFMFGFDKMMADVTARSAKSGLGWMVSTQDRFGVGNALISDQAQKNAGILNPGKTPNDGKMLSGLVDYDLSTGIYYAFVGRKFRASVALGYNFGATMIVNWGGAASNASELGYDASFTLQRNGPILRGIFLF